jgi:hypothetical protein
VWVVVGFFPSSFELSASQMIIVKADLFVTTSYTVEILKAAWY